MFTQHTPDSGLSTGTGNTLASDLIALQNEQKALKDPMTPVAEESSRSSKASKSLSREGTLNLTSSSFKRKDKNRPSISSRKEEIQISSSLKKTQEVLIKETGDGLQSVTLTEREGSRKSDDLALGVQANEDNRSSIVAGLDENGKSSVAEGQKEPGHDAPSMTSENSANENNGKLEIIHRFMTSRKNNDTV